MPVGDNDMVEKIDAHGFASGLHTTGQLVVGRAGLRMVAGMIVSQSQHSGIAEQGFFQHDAHVDSCFAQTAMADTKRLYEPEMLIEQQHPCLFDIKILHAWMQHAAKMVMAFAGPTPL